MDQLSAHLDRGWDLVARGDFSGAMVSARKSLEIDGECPEALNLMGFIHAAEGEPELALERYRQALEVDEGFLEAMLNAAEVLIHPMGEIDDALTLLDDALECCETPDETTETLLLKVAALLQHGDRDGAIAVVNKIPSGPYENPQMEFLVGKAHFEVGNLDAAQPLIEEAARKPKQDNPDVFYYLGLILEAREDARGATVAFLKTRELDEALPEGARLSREQFEKRARAAIARLPRALSDKLEGALVVVGDRPGAEVVAEGVDPRTPLLLDDVRRQSLPDSRKENESQNDNEPSNTVEPRGHSKPLDDPAAARVERLFLYQNNLERSLPNIAELENEILRLLWQELIAVFPELEQTLSVSPQKERETES